VNKKWTPRSIGGDVPGLVRAVVAMTVMSAMSTMAIVNTIRSERLIESNLLLPGGRRGRARAKSSASYSSSGFCFVQVIDVRERAGERRDVVRVLGGQGASVKALGEVVEQVRGGRERGCVRVFGASGEFNRGKYRVEKLSVELENTGFSSYPLRYILDVVYYDFKFIMQAMGAV
jgi:hypothetical protein